MRNRVVCIILISATAVMCLVTAPILEAVRAVAGGIVSCLMFYFFFSFAVKLLRSFQLPGGLNTVKAIYIFSRIALIILGLAFLFSFALSILGMKTQTTCTMSLGALFGIIRYRTKSKL